jgi:dipeptidyl aminopeptidase/acylaminoacyl peptidase
MVVIGGLPLCALLAAPAAAPATLSLPDVIAFATVREVAVSPDGRTAAVAVRRGDLDADAFRTEVWSVDLAGQAAERRLTFGDGGASNLRWSPSGADITFVSKRGERAQVWALPTAGGEARPLTSHAESVSGFEWSPDGQRLLLRAPPPETDDEAQRRRKKDDARADGWQWRRHRLWIVSLRGGVPAPLTDGSRHVQAAAWAPDGKRVALVTTATPEADSSLDARLEVLDVATGARSEVPGSGLASDPRWSRDGRALAFVRPFDGRELSRNDAFVWTVGSDRARNVSAALDRDVEDVRWNFDGTALEVHHALGAVSGVARVEVATGRVRPLWRPERALLSATHGGPGWVFVPGDAPAEVWVADGSGGSARPRTRWNEGLGARLRPRLEIVRWRSGAGEVEGVLAHPTTTASGRSPLLVIPHGGPRDHTSALFDPQTAYFTSLGYLVLRPNFRGSTGYGDAFTRANVANWGAGPFEDMMTGVDALIARGLADPARLFLYGWSYGGYLTNWAVTHTDRFRAAASGAGVADLRMQYAISDARRWRFDYFSGSPFTGHQDLYARQSPITYVASARVPTLFLHGEEDVRVPPAQGWMMYRGLRDAGVEAEMVVYPREGHGFEEPRHVLDRLRRIADWFARHDAGAP